VNSGRGPSIYAGIYLWLLPLVTGTWLAAARQAPPDGLKIPSPARAELQRGVDEFGRELDAAAGRLKRREELSALLPDVQVYHKAVSWALAYDEFFRSNEVEIARALLARGRERLSELEAGQPSWIHATGLVVRGYRSRIDDSVQPYGLVVPAGWRPNAAPSRLDVWLHGRDNLLTELKFIHDRQRSSGEFTPENTFVLHPYGRYCNAFKFAGEMDVFEALEAVRRHYPIDPKRLAVRGFSMGGAGCWHLAAHHPGLWRAAAPGAGFVETPEYTGALTRAQKPPGFEQQLWHLYDAADVALNLGNLFVIAYSGERDKQKQAADVMAREMTKESLELRHLLGPGVEHKYEPATKRQLAEEFDRLMTSNEHPWTRQVRFTTWTLRYPTAGWVSADQLGSHWQRARIDAGWGGESDIVVRTTNVTALHFDPSETDPPLNPLGAVRVSLNEQSFAYRNWKAATKAMSRGYEMEANRWRPRRVPTVFPPPKQPMLQGPVDDAFMDSFLMVRPTGQPWHPQTGAWCETELAHATNEWRAQFRGMARVKNDTEVTSEDLRLHHLILWGDPQSNRWLRRLLPRLPLRWSRAAVQFAGKTFPASESVPVLIYPNPLYPSRYVVLNSGFTFCESGAGTNARQTPKLPDYAVLNVGTPHSSRPAEGVLLAGFFGEHWEVKP